MQTFVPHDSFRASASALDWRRLGKQRVECLQLLQALDPLSPRRGWANHPAAAMWRGYEGALACYGLAIVNEWVERGYNDIKCGPQIQTYADRFVDATLPPWWGDYDVHLSHRSNLIRKAPEFYRPQWPMTPDNLPYIWPTTGA